jgi:hypothetical protein
VGKNARQASIHSSDIRGHSLPRIFLFRRKPGSESNESLSSVSIFSTYIGRPIQSEERDLHAEERLGSDEKSRDVTRLVDLALMRGPFSRMLGDAFFRLVTMVVDGSMDDDSDICKALTVRVLVTRKSKHVIASSRLPDFALLMLMMCSKNNAQ